jgi:putative phosphoesterase
MRALILSDTHLRPGRMTLPEGVRAILGGAVPASEAGRDGRPDVILHAGDLVDPSVLSLLGNFAPVRAVLGNNDVQLRGRLPERMAIDLDGVNVSMVHDSGPRTGRARRLQRWFPDAHVVVFGHSHLPVDEVGEAGQRLFNPGSATERRRAPRHTCGLLDVADGSIVDLRLVDLGP